MTVEISPALHEIIVAVSRKAVDERLEEIAITRRDFDEVRAALRDLAVAQARTEQRMEELAVARQDLAAVQKEVAAILERFDTWISDLKGWQLELRYQERAVAYFGPLLRRMRTTSGGGSRWGPSIYGSGGTRRAKPPCSGQ